MLFRSDAYVYGYTVLQYTYKENVKKKTATGLDINVRVLNTREYELRSLMSKRGNRLWFPFRRSNPLEQTQNLQPLKNTRVFLFPGSEPEPISQMPQSHMQRAMRSILALDEVMSLTGAVAYRRAAPLLVYNSDITKQIYPAERTNWQAFANEAQNVGTSRHFGAAGHFSETPEGGAQTMTEVIMNPEMRNELSMRQSVAAIAKSVNDQVEQSNMYRLPSTTDDGVDYATKWQELIREHPDQPAKLLAPGTTLDVHSPESKSLENFIEYQSQLRREIASCFGVPPEFIGAQGASMTAAIVADRKMAEIRTTSVHKWLSECISSVFLDLHYEDVSKDIGLSVARILRGANPDVKKPIQLHDGLLMRDKYRDFIDNQLVINIHFTESAVASEETLLNLLRLKVISHDTYARFMLATNGISESVKMKLSEKDKKEVVEMLNGMLPEQNGGAAAAPGKRSTSAGPNSGELSSKRQKTGTDSALDKIEKAETSRAENASKVANNK